MHVTRPDLPTGDTATQTTAPGSLYHDPQQRQLVRIRGREEGGPEFNVEIWTHESAITDRPDRVTTLTERELDTWDADLMRSFVAQDHTALLATHNYDGTRPYGVFNTDGNGVNCPECGQYMHADHRYNPCEEDGPFDGSTEPALLCPDQFCNGHLTVVDLLDRDLYVTPQDYLIYTYTEETLYRCDTHGLITEENMWESTDGSSLHCSYCSIQQEMNEALGEADVDTQEVRAKLEDDPSLP